MKLRIVVPVTVVILLSLACPKKDAVQEHSDQSNILRISASKSGEIQANGKAVSLPELDGLLEANAKTNGVVWYYREAGTEEPPQQAMEAIALIAKHRSPLSMSSKPDFSDTIDASGNSVPRRK